MMEYLSLIRCHFNDYAEHYPTLYVMHVRMIYAYHNSRSFLINQNSPVPREVLAGLRSGSVVVLSSTR